MLAVALIALGLSIVNIPEHLEEPVAHTDGLIYEAFGEGYRPVVMEVEVDTTIGPGDSFYFETTCEVERRRRPTRRSGMDGKEDAVVVSTRCRAIEIRDRYGAIDNNKARVVKSLAYYQKHGVLIWAGYNDHVPPVRLHKGDFIIAFVEAEADCHINMVDL